MDARRPDRLRRRARLAVSAAATVALSACGVAGGQTVAGADHSVAWHGVEPNPAQDRPSFVLRDTDGNRFDFQQETAGQPTLVYFGYTHCPDECPTAMADIAAALRRTPAELREQVKVVLVTTDPERDTPAVLRTWLDRFSTEFIGLVGSVEDVDAAQIAAGIQPATQEGPIPTLSGRPDEHPHQQGTAPHVHDGPLGYGVGHSNVIFGYKADDTLPVLYPAGVLPDDIAADLPALAEK